MLYRILIVSPVVVFDEGGTFKTIDLWARDLEFQARLANVRLVCPVATGQGGTAINPRIQVSSEQGLSNDVLGRIVCTVDVVQVPGHAGWASSSLARRVLKVAKRHKRTVILGVSSNRAKTAWLNSRNKIIGGIRYLDIRISQAWLASKADGVFVVGHGISQFFKRLNRNVHIDIASWIQESDIAPLREVSPGPITICLASRMEKMKGMLVGIAAIERVRATGLDFKLLIVGDGPERKTVEATISSLGLSALTTIMETVPYPDPFLQLLHRSDLVLITNLNDEQPRLIFDAISQGCLPICPDTPAYRGLCLDGKLFYKRGDAVDLSRAIASLADPGLRTKLKKLLLPMAQKFTIENMHKERSRWVASLVNKRNIIEPKN